jgi:hypothetical protein
MMKRYFVFAIVMIASLVLGISTSISAMQPQTGATEAPASGQSMPAPKKKKNGVERAGSDIGRSTKKTSKAVAKSGSKTSKAVGKSSKSMATDTGEVVGAGAKAVAKGAKETAEAPARLVRKIKRRSNSKAQ